MRMAKCICNEGGTISVQGPDFGRTFGAGSRVDLDAPVTSTNKQTWGEAIGDRYTHLFQEEIVLPPARKKAVREDQE